MFALGVVVVAVLHFATTFFALFAVGISGESENRLLSIIANFFTFPLQFIPNNFELPAGLGLLPWFLVSLLWGFAICSLIRLIARNAGVGV